MRIVAELLGFPLFIGGSNGRESRPDLSPHYCSVWSQSLSQSQYEILPASARLKRKFRLPFRKNIKSDLTRPDEDPVGHRMIHWQKNKLIQGRNRRLILFAVEGICRSTCPRRGKGSCPAPTQCQRRIRQWSRKTNEEKAIWRWSSHGSNGRTLIQRPTKQYGLSRG